MWPGSETNTGYEDGSTLDAQKGRTHWASLTFALVLESDSLSRAGREVGSPALGGLQKSWGKCLTSCHLRTSPFSLPSQCPCLQCPLTCWSQWSLPSIKWILPVPDLLTNVNPANVLICSTVKVIRVEYSLSEVLGAESISDFEFLFWNFCIFIIDSLRWDYICHEHFCISYILWYVVQK